MHEEWRDIEGYEGLYQVSNLGRVKSLDRYVDYGNAVAYRKGRILKAGKSSGGYLQVELWNNKKVFHPLIHRLVAQAFIPNPENLPEVNHKDENPSNNAVDNLEWCDRMYNIHYGTGIRRRTEKKSMKVVMCDLAGNEIEEFQSVNDASRKTRVSAGNISECCRGRRRTANDCKWKYKQ